MNTDAVSLNRLRRPRPGFQPTRRFELTRELAFGSVGAQMARKSLIMDGMDFKHKLP